MQAGTLAWPTGTAKWNEAIINVISQTCNCSAMRKVCHAYFKIQSATDITESVVAGQGSTLLTEVYTVENNCRTPQRR